MQTVYDFELKDIDGNVLPLANFRGYPVLVVNVASECGLTPQYEQLQALHQRYAGRGLVVLGVPCNQFGAQEPGSEQEIKQFCSSRYAVTFPMVAKMDVNGQMRHPLYEWLVGKYARFPGDISWNFEKFLLDRAGTVIQRFSPKVKPDEKIVCDAIESLL